MKFKYKLPPLILTLLIILIVTEVVTIFYFFAKMFGWFGLFSNNLVTEISTTVLCFIALAVVIALLALQYRFTKTHLTLKVAFFDILGNRVKISNILNILHDKQSKTLYISYMYKDGYDPIITQICISPKDFDNFCNALRALNSNIIYNEKD